MKERWPEEADGEVAMGEGALGLESEAGSPEPYEDDFEGGDVGNSHSHSAEIQDAISKVIAAQELTPNEAQKWEKILDASEQAAAAASQQVQELMKQLASMRARAEEAEEKAKDAAAAKDAEITRMRLDFLQRGKKERGRVKEGSESASRASEARALIAAREEWEMEKRELEGELERLRESKELGVDNGALLKRERGRAKKLEKHIDALNVEIEQLKGQQLKQQATRHTVVHNLSAEAPEVTKLHKQVEMYKNEARMLRSQVDAQRPEKLIELQGMLKQKLDEEDHLKDEIKTLKNLMGRQERAINQNKNADSEYASKLQGLVGDLQVSKEENRRLKERLELQEKSAKSRSAIEESLRKKAETLERKVAKLRGGGGDSVLMSPGTAEQENEHVRDLGRLKGEVDGWKRKFVEMESERNKLRNRLKEKGETLKTLQEALERKDQELQSRSVEARSLAVQLAELKRQHMSNKDSKKVQEDRDTDQQHSDDVKSSKVMGDAASRASKVGGDELKSMQEQLTDRDKRLYVAGETIRTLEEEVQRLRAVEEDNNRRSHRPPTEDESVSQPAGASRHRSGVPTSLADMAEMTTPRASVFVTRAGSSRQRVRPRSQAGEARLNEGLEVLGVGDEGNGGDPFNVSVFDNSDRIQGGDESFEGGDEFLEGGAESFGGGVLDDSGDVQGYQDDFEEAEV